MQLSRRLPQELVPPLLAELAQLVVVMLAVMVVVVVVVVVEDPSHSQTEQPIAGVPLLLLLLRN